MFFCFCIEGNERRESFELIVFKRIPLFELADVGNGLVAYEAVYFTFAFLFSNLQMLESGRLLTRLCMWNKHSSRLGPKVLLVCRQQPLKRHILSISIQIVHPGLLISNERAVFRISHASFRFAAERLFTSLKDERALWLGRGLYYLEVACSVERCC